MSLVFITQLLTSQQPLFFGVRGNETPNNVKEFKRMTIPNFFAWYFFAKATILINFNLAGNGKVHDLLIRHSAKMQARSDIHKSP